MKLIVTSKEDIASTNMYKLFISEFGFVEDGTYDEFTKYNKDDFVLIHTKKGLVEIEELCNSFTPEVYICASRHRSEKGNPSLTVHYTGNWNNADYGGSPKSVNLAPACYGKKALQSINAVPGFDITLEVTHHGPTAMNAPLLFIEVGSSENEWNNLDACRSICKAILSLDSVSDCETVVGFGGPHYAPNFTKVMLNSNYAIGHMCPKHFCDSLSEEVVMDAINKTIPKPSFAVIDWKGTTSDQRAHIISILDKNNVEWKKVKELKN